MHNNIYVSRDKHEVNMAKRFVKGHRRTGAHKNTQKCSADELRDTISFLAYRNNKLFSHVQDIAAENFILKQRADKLENENNALKMKITLLESGEML